MEKIRWIDMIDPVYTLARLVGLEPEKIDIESIIIMSQRLIIRYSCDGKSDFISVPYEV